MKSVPRSNPDISADRQAFLLYISEIFFMTVCGLSFGAITIDANIVITIIIIIAVVVVTDVYV